MFKIVGYFFGYMGNIVYLCMMIHDMIILGYRVYPFPKAKAVDNFFIYGVRLDEYPNLIFIRNKVKVNREK